MKYLFLFILLLNTKIYGNDTIGADGIDVSKSSFPWELVIDRGKILGCIYNNKFYSIGSILIEETLPRKCQLNSAREGIWSELSGSELAEYNESIERQQMLAVEKEKRIAESTVIGSTPLSREEAMIIRYLRANKQAPN
jgi:hypothetical protein